MKVGIKFPELVKLVSIPNGLSGKNRSGEQLFHRGFMVGLQDVRPLPMGDISFREGYWAGRGER